MRPWWRNDWSGTRTLRTPVDVSLPWAIRRVAPPSPVILECIHPSRPTGQAPLGPTVCCRWLHLAVATEYSAVKVRGREFWLKDRDSPPPLQGESRYSIFKELFWIWLYRSGLVVLCIKLYRSGWDGSDCSGYQCCLWSNQLYLSAEIHWYDWGKTVVELDSPQIAWHAPDTHHMQGRGSWIHARPRRDG